MDITIRLEKQEDDEFGDKSIERDKVGASEKNKANDKVQ